MTVVSIAPKSRTRMRLLLRKAADTLRDLAQGLSDEHERARLTAKAEQLKQRAERMV